MKASFCKISPLGRKRGSLPNFGITCIVALFCLSVLYWGGFHLDDGIIRCKGPGWYDLPGAKNDHDVIEPHLSMVPVFIDKWGYIYVNHTHVEDFSRFQRYLEDLLEEFKSPPWILLKAHQDTEFGKIQLVLKAAMMANVEVVSLITNERAAYFELVDQQR
jgi:biopolymer transport protein ExbD